MKGDTRHTYLFKTADGWARRVLASNERNARIILREEIAAAPVAQFHAYRAANESKRLDEFRTRDFITCEVEH